MPEFVRRLRSEALEESEGGLSHDGRVPVFDVYILSSVNAPEKTCKGFTADLKTRLRDLNAGRSKHTAKYAPWELVTYVAFADKRKAQEFEHDLKTGSGAAFARKRLI